jgi:hypothetical protein
VFLWIIPGADEKPRFSATARLAANPLGSNDLAKYHAVVRRATMAVHPSRIPPSRMPSIVSNGKHLFDSARANRGEFPTANAQFWDAVRSN